MAMFEQLSFEQLQIIVVVVASAVMGIGAMMLTAPLGTLQTVVAGGALICVGAVLFVGGVVYFEVRKI